MRVSSGVSLSWRGRSCPNEEVRISADSFEVCSFLRFLCGYSPLSNEILKGVEVVSKTSTDKGNVKDYSSTNLEYSSLWVLSIGSIAMLITRKGPGSSLSRSSRIFLSIPTWTNGLKGVKTDSYGWAWRTLRDGGRSERCDTDASAS